MSFSRIPDLGSLTHNSESLVTTFWVTKKLKFFVNLLELFLYLVKLIFLVVFGMEEIRLRDPE
jgi:hypothetical protein